MASPGTKNSTLSAYCLKDNATGDVIIKIVSAVLQKKSKKSPFHPGNITAIAILQLLTGEPTMKNTMQQPYQVLPQKSGLMVKKTEL